MSNAYYATRGHVALNCWTCDQPRCKCDRAQMRAVKRGAKQRWRRDVAQEANCLDLELDIRDALASGEQDHSPYFCLFCQAAEEDRNARRMVDEWVEWLREQEVYPPPPLTRPLLQVAS